VEAVLVTAPLRQSAAHYANALAGRCHLTFLTELEGVERDRALRSADIVIAGHVRQELTAGETARLENVRFIQLLHAGTDHIPFSILPKGIPIACTRGKGAAVMSEHVMALALACSRRVVVEDRAMRAGQFNMYAHGPRVLAGGTCAILGFGGVGHAVARLCRTMGMRIHAINRSGVTSEQVDFIGTVADLEVVLRQADLIAVTMALTAATAGLLGARELAWMKEDAILVNVSRAGIINEAALYRRLVECPNFSAGLDVWWIEPLQHGEFRTGYPLLELPNVVASPHNSAQAWNCDLGLAETLDNVIRVLDGQPPSMLVHDDEKLL
jgi:phosphoglycerate dehydrogenase-like enzyme